MYEPWRLARGPHKGTFGPSRGAHRGLRRTIFAPTLSSHLNFRSSDASPTGASGGPSVLDTDTIHPS